MRDKMMRNTITRMILAAAIGMAVGGRGMGTAAFAQSILDQQLGEKQNDAPKPTTPPKADTTPEPNADQKTPARPVAPDMISPSASKAVDDMDLVNKLTGADANKQGGGGDADEMKQMLDRMGQSQTRLVDQDPGAITQETQKRIVNDLDVMIEIARKQQQGGKGQQKQNGKPQDGQKRQQSSGQQQGPHDEGGNQAATDSKARSGSAATPQSNGEDMHQKTPQEWGNLPPRDRDLISNGANEQYLPSYKEMIDRYYQSLAEIGKSKEK
jgi:hypothetical protein